MSQPLIYQFEHMTLTVTGSSHGEALGIQINGLPTGIAVDETELQTFMNRRAPGNYPWSTERKETDHVIFLSGIRNGMTDGSTVSAEIPNLDKKSSDYSYLADTPRPSHADYTAKCKYGTAEAGGGVFSGRMTAPLCIAGYLCGKALKAKNISVFTHLSSVGDIHDDTLSDYLLRNDSLPAPFAPGIMPVINPEIRAKMQNLIIRTKKEGDSIGGTIECAVTGLPVGIGGPGMEGLETAISSPLFAIPAVKGVEFGNGFAGSLMFGSEYNDSFCYRNGSIQTETNHCGGILGGISNGMPLLFRVAMKPTPSIQKEQKTVSYSKKEETIISVPGRHDPCLAVRAVPVIESMAAVAVLDRILEEPNCIPECRAKIDRIDAQICELLRERMHCSETIKMSKKETGKPVFDPTREKQILELVRAATSPYESYTERIYHEILSCSKDLQKEGYDDGNEQ